MIGYPDKNHMATATSILTELKALWLEATRLKGGGV